jgi:prepilin-type N-terminal cleavage/methylation domain-containing protein
MERRAGFTLLEIVIALGIAAVIISAGIAPLLYSARMMNEARGNFAESNRERSAANRIFADVRSSAGLSRGAALKVAPLEALEAGENDFLAVRALSTADTTRPLGTAVWGVPGGVTVRGDFKPGLYRWIVSPDADPSAVNAAELDPGDGTLVLPGTASVTFAALRGSEWTRDYSGAMPRALRVTFNYDDDLVSYEEILPNF